MEQTSTTPSVTFATECYGYGPTSGGGRIYTAKGAKTRSRNRGMEAKRRRSLKSQYRNSKTGLSFKAYVRRLEAKAA